jgi:hypothetical protein
MSHFTVLVVGDDVDEQLAPFQENNMGTCPSEYMEFVSTEADMREEWDKNEKSIDQWHAEHQENVRLEKYNELAALTVGEEKHVVSLDRCFLNKPKTGDRVCFYYHDGDRHDEVFCEIMDVLPLAKGQRPVVNVKRIDAPPSKTIQEQYGDFDTYAKDYHSARIDDVMNQYGFWENPNAKWDWYQIGGRWSGFFKVKGVRCDEHVLLADHKVGEPGVFGNKAKEGYADQVRKADIDFEGIKADTTKEAHETYDKFEKVVEGILPPTKTWEEHHKEFTALGIGIDAVRDAWHDQPFIKAVRKAEYDNTLPCVGSCPVKYYCVLTGGRDQFVKEAVSQCFSTFAVLMDGKWYERGKMGWWAFVSDEKDNWGEEYMKLLESVPADTLLTVVDCHI